VEIENDPQLWALLGRSPRPSPSPFFARNVLRSIRELRPAKICWRWRAVVPLTGLAALALAAAVAFWGAELRNNQATADRQLSAELDELFAWDDEQLIDDDLSGEI
jgi:hypothetical protein